MCLPDNKMSDASVDGERFSLATLKIEETEENKTNGAKCWIKYSDVCWRKQGLFSLLFLSHLKNTVFMPASPSPQCQHILTLDPSNYESWPIGTLWAPRADTLGSPLQCKFSSLLALIVNDFHFKTPKALLVLPWYWALKPLNLWLPSDVKCSRSQFLLLIMGDGRLGPVNLQRKSRDGFSLLSF